MTTILEENKEEERIYSNFINSLRSPVTKEQYATALKHYMKFHGLNTYSQLVIMPHDQIFESIK